MKSTVTGTEFRFIESVGDACLVVDASRTVIAANEPVEKLYLRPLDEVVGSPITDLAPPEESALLLAEISACNGEPRHFRVAQKRADARFVGEFTAKTCRLGDADTVVLMVREVCSQQPNVLRDLTLNTLMLNHVTDGIICHSIEGELLFANRAALETWGMQSLAAAKSLGPFGWVPLEQRVRLTSNMNAILESGEARFESHGMSPAGRQTHVEVHSTLVETPAGAVIVSAVRDIRERMEAEEMVRYLAYHDTLTGLANRVLLESDLAHALSMSERHGDLVGLIYLDLNAFKPVNDTYGHAIGDLVLREVADRITGCVRETDTVARPGGDEFVVLLSRIDSPESLTTVARKLAEEIERDIFIKGIDIRISASIGLAVHEPGEDSDSFLARADLAMYEAREKGLAGWELFSAV